MENINLKKAIRLLPSHQYCTYQLYGVMANANTLLEDGLKIGALTCIQWLFDRLEGNQIPEEIICLKDIDYKKLDVQQLKSFSVNRGYSLDVQANPEDGFWALRIIEPDLGAASNDDASPVAGRVIETNIAFTVANDQLQCGFCTMISDLEGTEPADCYRFSVIKRLWSNPAFGLKHIVSLDNASLNRIDNETELRKCCELIQNHDNQLPILLCIDPATSLHHLRQLMNNDATVPLIGKPDFKTLLFKKTKSAPVVAAAVEEKPFEWLQTSLGGYAHCFVISYQCAEQLLKRYCSPLKEDDHYIQINPSCFDGKIIHFANLNKAERQQIRNFSRNRLIDYHQVMFYNKARRCDWQKKQDEQFKQQENLQKALQQNDTLVNQVQRQQRIETHQNDPQGIEFYKEENRRLQKYSQDLESGLNSQLLQYEQENEQLKQQHRYDAKLLEYYRRKEQRPKNHNEIIDWAERYFPRLSFDDKARKLMENNAATRVPLNTICDALDYLGTLYCDLKFEQSDEEECRALCSHIYDRPYDVSPSGYSESDSSERKIRYQHVGQRKHEIPLDQHLKIGGNFDDDLLRIYFVIDAQRKLLVIGSLPNHL